MRLKVSFILSLLITYTYGSVEAGREVYLINCANCHSTNMSGSLGKDFNMVSYTRTKKEILEYVTNPGQTFKKFGYSANAMPTLPLSEVERQDVVDYIDHLQPFKKWMKSKP